MSYYPVEQVIQCLFDELKSFEYGDDAWRLARVFADIPQKYSVDRHIYSWLKNSTLHEKDIFLNFLAGYYYNAAPNIHLFIKFAEELVEIITDSSHSNWNEETILLGIEAIVYGYQRINPHFFREKKERKEYITQQFRVFKIYILKANHSSSGDGILAGLKLSHLGVDSD